MKVLETTDTICIGYGALKCIDGLATKDSFYCAIAGNMDIIHLCIQRVRMMERQKEKSIQKKGKICARTKSWS